MAERLVGLGPSGGAAVMGRCQAGAPIRSDGKKQKLTPRWPFPVKLEQGRESNGSTPGVYRWAGWPVASERLGRVAER